MSQILPTEDFKYEDPATYNWRNPPEGRGCIIECALQFTKIARFLTSKFPLAPEKMKVNAEDLSELQLKYLQIKNKKVCNVEKLILNLKDNDKYVDKNYYKLRQKIQ